MSARRRKVVLVNPNTNAAVTARMLARARQCAGGRIDIEGMTVERGALLITDDATLAVAAHGVVALAPELGEQADGVIIAAFGDPGLARLRALLAIPAVGIGEAALEKAAFGGRRFGVITTTPDLVAAIDAKVAAQGLSPHYGGVILTHGDAVQVTNTPALLKEQLCQAAARASRMGIEAAAIGGGPLADAGRAIAGKTSVILVDPIEAAVERIIIELDAMHPDPAAP